MSRSILILFIATLAAAGTQVAAQICSPRIIEALAPCTCQEEPAAGIYCEEDTDLQAVFVRVTPLIEPDFIFDSLHITNQNTTELPPHLTSLKFDKIRVDYNPNLEFIHEDAFNGTTEVTRILNLGDNALVSNSTHHAIFNLVSKFTRAEDINLWFNQIHYIPSDPFSQLMPNLQNLTLRANRMLEGVGSRIFANLPALQNAQLASCSISLELLAPDAFEGIGPQVDLNMMHNDFTQLPQEIFGSVMESASMLRIGGEYCRWGDCFHIRQDCDDDVSTWLCENEADYRPKLEGFFCQAVGDETIFDYCQKRKE